MVLARAVRRANRRSPGYWPQGGDLPPPPGPPFGLLGGGGRGHSMDCMDSLRYLKMPENACKCLKQSDQQNLLNLGKRKASSGTKTDSWHRWEIGYAANAKKRMRLSTFFYLDHVSKSKPFVPCPWTVLENVALKSLKKCIKMPENSEKNLCLENNNACQK